MEKFNFLYRHLGVIYTLDIKDITPQFSGLLIQIDKENNLALVTMWEEGEIADSRVVGFDLPSTKDGWDKIPRWLEGTKENIRIVSAFADNLSKKIGTSL